MHRWPTKDSEYHLFAKRAGDSCQALRACLLPAGVLVTHDLMLLGLALTYGVPRIVFDNSKAIGTRVGEKNSEAR